MLVERNRALEHVEGRVARSTARSSSLMSAMDWNIWLTYWNSRVHNKTAEERWIVDACLMLHQGCIKLARGLRYSMHKMTYNSDGYVLELETKDPQELAREMLSWYARTKPTSIDKLGGEKGEEVRFMARAIEGAFITIVRIADEQAAIKRTGYLVVNASPSHAEDEFPEGSKEKA